MMITLDGGQICIEAKCRRQIRAAGTYQRGTELAMVRGMGEEALRPAISNFTTCHGWRNLELPSGEAAASVSRDRQAEAGWGCSRKRRPRVEKTTAGFPRAWQSNSCFSTVMLCALASYIIQGHRQHFSAMKDLSKARFYFLRFFYSLWVQSQKYLSIN